MDFGRIAAILKRRILLLLSCVLVTMALTWGMTRLTGSRWLATVTFLIPSSSPLTEATKDKSETPMMDSKGQSAIFAAIAKSPDVLQVALKKVKIAPPRDLVRQIDFDAIGARLYELKVADSNPSRAEQLANSIADTFITENDRLNRVTAQRNLTLLEGQLRERSRTLEVARKKYVDYCAANNIQGEGANGQIILAQRRQENAQLSAAQIKERIDSNNTRLSGLRARMGKIPATVNVDRPYTQRIDLQFSERNIAELKQRLATMRQRYEEANPRIIELKQYIEDAEREYNEAAGTPKYSVQANPLASAIETDVKSLESQIKADESILVNQQASIDEATAEIARLSSANTPLSSLATEVANATNSKTAMESRVLAGQMQFDVAAQQKSLVILERVNASNPPANTSSGKTLKLMLLGALVAAIVLSGILIMMDSGDNRLKSIEGAENLLGLPVRASIPPPQGSVSALSLVRAAELHPLSPHAEAFRFLGHHFLHTHNRNAIPRSIMMLSAKAKQGNTNTAVNLALTLAQAGHRVILVDGNTRTPSLHEIFEIDNDTGLTTVLSNPTEEMISATLRPTNLSNLLILPSGPPSDNPWELFSTQGVQTLSINLLGRADYVIYDTPSALAYTDAMNLGEIAEAALMCIRVTDRLSGQEARVVQMFQMQGVQVVGSVLKDVPASFIQESQRMEIGGSRFVESANEALPPFAIESAQSNLPVKHTVAPPHSSPAETSPVEVEAVATLAVAPLTAEDLRTILGEVMREKSAPLSEVEAEPVIVAPAPAFAEEEIEEAAFVQVTVLPQEIRVSPSPVSLNSENVDAEDEESVMQSQFHTPDVTYTPVSQASDEAMRLRVGDALNRVEVLERQLEERNRHNDLLSEESRRLANELLASQQRLAEVEVQESAAADAVMFTSQARIKAEEEVESLKTAAQVEAEGIKETARMEAEAMMQAARKQLEEAQAVGMTYLNQAEQVKQQALQEAERIVQEAQNNATALLNGTRQTAEIEAEMIRVEAQDSAHWLLAEAGRRAEEVNERVATAYEEHLKTLGDDIVAKLRQSIQTQLAQFPSLSSATPLRNGLNGIHSMSSTTQESVATGNNVGNSRNGMNGHGK